MKSTTRVGARWYLFAAFYMVAVMLTVAIVHRIATGTWPRFGDTPWFIMGLAVVTSTWTQAGEEIGWRGYAFRVSPSASVPRRSGVLPGLPGAADCPTARLAD